MNQFLNVSPIRKGLVYSTASESHTNTLGFSGGVSLWFEISAVDHSHR